MEKSSILFLLLIASVSFLCQYGPDKKTIKELNIEYLPNEKTVGSLCKHIDADKIIKTATINKEEKKTQFRFGIIGDTQLNKRAMIRGMHNIKRNNLDFFVHLGDIDSCGHKFLWKASRRYLSLSNTPYHMVIGNHELWTCGAFYKYSKRRWVKFWHGKGDTLRHFKYLDKTFLFIDTSSKTIPRQHISKIKTILENAKPKSVFMFGHHPLAYPTDIKIKYGKFGITKHKKMGGLRYTRSNKMLWSTLKSYRNKILAYFHGHYHAYRKYSMDGIPVYNSGGGGGALETKWDFHHYLVVIVEGNKYKIRVVKF